MSDPTEPGYYPYRRPGRPWTIAHYDGRDVYFFGADPAGCTLNELYEDEPDCEWGKRIDLSEYLGRSVQQ